MFFDFVLGLILSPIQPFLQLTLDLLREPINISLFMSLWVIVVYCLSMFYAMLLVGTGFTFLLAGYNSEKREQAKEWLRNIIIMIILVQSSFFLYQLVIDLSSTMTSAILTLIDPHFFTISASSLNGLAISILLGGLYLLVLLNTFLILIVRYVIVCIGVVFLPLGIFFYFLPSLKQYGSLILNFLGICIFMTAIDAIILIGFSRLANLTIFSNLQIVVVITAFITIDILMMFLLFFAALRSAFRTYMKIKRLKI